MALVLLDQERLPGHVLPVDERLGQATVAAPRCAVARGGDVEARVEGAVFAILRDRDGRVQPARALLREHVATIVGRLAHVRIVRVVGREARQPLVAAGGALGDRHVEHEVARLDQAVLAPRLVLHVVVLVLRVLELVKVRGAAPVGVEATRRRRRGRRWRGRRRRGRRHRALVKVGAAVARGGAAGAGRPVDEPGAAAPAGAALALVEDRLGQVDRRVVGAGRVVLHVPRGLALALVDVVALGRNGEAVVAARQPRRVGRARAAVVQAPLRRLRERFVRVPERVLVGQRQAGPRHAVGVAAVVRDEVDDVVARHLGRERGRRRWRRGR